MAIPYRYTGYEAKIPSPSPSLYGEMKAIDREALEASLRAEQKKLEKERGSSTEGINRAIKKGLVVLATTSLLGLLFWIIGLGDVAWVFLLVAAGAFLFTLIGVAPASSSQSSWVDAAAERTAIYLRIHKLANSSADYGEFEKRYGNLYEETEDPDVFSKAGRSLGKKYMQWKNKSKH